MGILDSQKAAQAPKQLAVALRTAEVRDLDFATAHFNENALKLALLESIVSNAEDQLMRLEATDRRPPVPGPCGQASEEEPLWHIVLGGRKKPGTSGGGSSAVAWKQASR